MFATRSFVKKRLLLALFIICGSLLAILIAHRHNPQNKTYQGKPLKAWCWQIYSPDPLLRQEATATFRNMGAEAVPGLISLLSTKDSPVNELLWSGLTKLP